MMSMSMTKTKTMPMPMSVPMTMPMSVTMTMAMTRSFSGIIHIIGHVNRLDMRNIISLSREESSLAESILEGITLADNLGISWSRGKISRKRALLSLHACKGIS